MWKRSAWEWELGWSALPLLRSIVKYNPLTNPCVRHCKETITYFNQPVNQSIINLGVWDKSGCVIKSVGNPTYPVTRMCVVMGAVWCATHNTIKRLDPVNHTVMDVTTLNADPR